MKKILFVFFAFSSVMFAQAQSSSPNKIAWHYVLGINLSDLRIENADNTDLKTGLVTGFAAEIKLAPKLDIQPQFLYSSMGGRNLAGGVTSLRLNYFSLPVLATYQLSQKWSVLAGPQIDVLIQAKEKSADGFEKTTNNFRENSFGLTGGLAVRPARAIGFSARYVYGFNNVATGQRNLQNQGVQVTTSLRL